MIKWTPPATVGCSQGVNGCPLSEEGRYTVPRAPKWEESEVLISPILVTNLGRIRDQSPFKHFKHFYMEKKTRYLVIKMKEPGG